jgi:hypothetical protein
VTNFLNHIHDIQTSESESKKPTVIDSDKLKVFFVLCRLSLTNAIFNLGFGTKTDEKKKTNQYSEEYHRELNDPKNKIGSKKKIGLKRFFL